jgi:hypothetical protein
VVTTTLPGLGCRRTSRHHGFRDHFVIFWEIAVPLSEDEKSRLDEIEAYVGATDPAFAQRLRAAHRPQAVDPERAYQRSLILLNSLLFISASVFANGLSAARGPISLGMVAALVGAVFTGWTALLLVRCRRSYRAPLG